MFLSYFSDDDIGCCGDDWLNNFRNIIYALDELRWRTMRAETTSFQSCNETFQRICAPFERPKSLLNVVLGSSGVFFIHLYLSDIRLHRKTKHFNHFVVITKIVASGIALISPSSLQNPRPKTKLYLIRWVRRRKTLNCFNHITYKAYQNHRRFNTLS